MMTVRSPRDPSPPEALTGLLCTVAALLTIGLVMVATATAQPDRSLFDEAFWTGVFGRQLLFVAFGAILTVVLALFAGPLLRAPALRFRLALGVYGLTVGALVLTLTPGFADPHRGSHRWLSLAMLGLDTGLQPSEFAKPALVLALSALLSRFDPRSLKRGLVPATAVIGICVALVGPEDFGTAALLAAVGGILLLAAGCRWRYLAGLAVISTAGMAWLVFSEEYRLQRITAFWNVWTDTQGAAYQPYQSLVTIASGGWFGKGLGAGIQKYGYLPEGHTDFIFAVICEETGVLGALLILGCFAVLAWLGLSVARRAVDPFHRMVALGLTASLVLQAFMNMAVVTVLAPTTGISLPFISAGGSGLISACISAGLLGALAREVSETASAAPETARPDRAAGPQPA